MGLCEIEFNKQSVKLLELCQVMSENLNEDHNTILKHVQLMKCVTDITLSAFPHPTQAMGILYGRPTS